MQLKDIRELSIRYTITYYYYEIRELTTFNYTNKYLNLLIEFNNFSLLLGSML